MSSVRHVFVPLGLYRLVGPNELEVELTSHRWQFDTIHQKRLENRTGLKFYNNGKTARCTDGRNLKLPNGLIIKVINYSITYRQTKYVKLRVLTKHNPGWPGMSFVANLDEFNTITLQEI